MRCTICKEVTEIKDLLIDDNLNCDKCKKIKCNIEKNEIIAKLDYEEIVKNGILKMTPIFYNDQLITANTREFNFDYYSGEEYLKEMCRFSNLTSINLYEKKEKYTFINILIGKTYDDFYRECSGAEDKLLISLLTTLEYNRFLAVGLIIWMKGNQPFEKINDKLMECIIQTLDMYKNMPKSFGEKFIGYEKLYCALEYGFAMDKLAFEYGIEALEYKREKNCESELNLREIKFDFKRIVQIMRALCILNNLKVECTEGRLKNSSLSIDAEGNLILNNDDIDFSKEYVNEMKITFHENILENYEKSINAILNIHKGFNIETIKKLISGIQKSCSQGDEYLVADEQSWIIAIMNTCDCSSEIANKIFKEFIFSIDETKVFSEKTRSEYRAMRKCLFRYENRYITIVNLLSFTLTNWMVSILIGEIDDQILKRKMQKIYNKLDTDFEKNVYNRIKDYFNLETIMWNVETKEIVSKNRIVELPGEIDVLFYLNKKIFVIECKNLELKCDPKASANEYNKLTKNKYNSFQDKLNKKVEVIIQNKTEVFDFLLVKEDTLDITEVVGVIVVKSFTDVSLIQTEGFEVVLVSNICEWIMRKAFCMD